MSPLRSAIVVLAGGFLLAGCNCGGGGGPDGGNSDSGIITPPPRLMLSSGVGTSADGGTRLIVNMGQPLVAPFSVSGAKKIEPGTFPQTKVK